MSDLSQGFDPAAANPDLGGGDLAQASSVQSTDAKLTALRAQGDLSTVGQVPPAVQLDLAARLDDPASFVAGVESEIISRTDRRYASTYQPQNLTPETAPLFDSPDSVGSELRRIVGDVTGTGDFGGAQVISSESIVNFRRKAIEGGYLPADTISLGNRWTPEDSAAFFDMRQEEIEAQISGKGFLSASVPQALETIGEWASPTGLLSAAVGGLIPGTGFVGAIGGWLGDMGDMGKLWKAFDETLDDLIFPVVNAVMLVNGVGVVSNFAMGARGLSAAGRVGNASLRTGGGFKTLGLKGSGLSTRLTRAAPGARALTGDVQNFVKASSLATRLQNTRRGAAMGRGMEGWRSFTNVAIAKKAIQQTSQVGLAARAESVLSASQGEDINFIYNGVINNPIGMGLSTMAEFAFTPRSLWTPGQLKSLGHRTGIPAAYKEMVTLTPSEQLGLAWTDSVSFWAEGMGTATRQRFDEMMEYEGPQGIVRFIGEGDEEMGLTKMNWATAVAGLNEVSYTEARALMPDADVGDALYRQVMFNSRNQSIAALRPLSETDLATKAGRQKLIYTMVDLDAAKDSRNAFKVREDAAKVWTKFERESPDEFIKVMRSRMIRHEAERTETWRKIAEAATPERLTETLLDMGDSFTNKRFTEFMGSSDVLADYANTRQRWIVDRFDGIADDLVTDEMDPLFRSLWQVEIADQKVSRPITSGKLVLGEGDDIAAQSIAGTVDPSQVIMADKLVPQPKMINSLKYLDSGKVTTIANKDAKLVPHYDNMIRKLDLYIGQRDALARAERHGSGPRLLESLTEFATEKGLGSIGDLTDEQVRMWRVGMVEDASDPFFRVTKEQEQGYFTFALRDVAAAGGDPSDALGAINGLLDDIHANSKIWDAYKVPSRMVDIDAKVKELRKMRNFAAVPVKMGKSGKSAKVAAELDKNGYVVVAGTSFLQHTDLLAVDGPLMHISNRRKVARSLGSWTGRVEPSQVAKLREQKFDQALTRQLGHAKAAQMTIDESATAELVHSRPVRLGGQRLEESIDLTTETGARHAREILGEIFDDLATQMSRSLEATRDQGRVSQVISRANHQSLPLHRWALREKAIRRGFKDRGSFTSGEIDAIVNAAKQASDIGSNVRGFASLEDHMIANSWVRGVLKSFSTHDEGFTKITAAQAVARVNPDASTITKVRQFSRASRDWYVGLGGEQFGAYNKAASTSAGLRVATGLAGAGYGWQKEGLEGALVGGAAGALGGRRLVNPRNMVRAALLSHGLEADNPLEAGLSVAGAVVGPRLLSKAVNPLVKSGGGLDVAGWDRYSGLADNLVHYRNYFRFSLSPIFDLQRFTEGSVLGVTGLGEDVPISKNYMRTVEKMVRKGADPEFAARFAQNNWGSVPGDQMRKVLMTDFAEQTDVLRGFDRGHSMVQEFEVVDDASRYMRDVGILGYNPHEQYAGAYAILVGKGMDKQEAAAKVWGSMTYGINGRSPIEQSINFVFFPFSFQKKYMTQMAQFLTDDMSRLIVVHDGLKAWNTLWEKTDFTEKWKDYAPILAPMRQVNALANGISAGEFGGINRPLADLFSEVGDSLGTQYHRDLFNAFIPQTLRITTQEDNRDLQDRMKRLLPLWRDGARMLKDYGPDQLQVLRGVRGEGAAVSRTGQVTRGWDEYGELRRQAQQGLGDQFGSITSALRSQNPNLKEFQDWYGGKVAILQAKYPAWQSDREEYYDRRGDKDAELKQISNTPDAKLTRGQIALKEFNEMYLRLKARLGESELDLVQDTEEIPEQVWEVMRRRAIDLAASSPGFLPLYDDYFMRLFGPLTERI